MQGTEYLGYQLLGDPGPSWRLAGATNLGDGTSDLLFQNSNGEVAWWTMNGATEVSYQLLGNPGTGWQLVGAANFGDATSDLLFQNSNGEVAWWTMQGTGYVSYQLLGNPGSGWQLEGALATIGNLTATTAGSGTEISGNATLELAAASSATIDFAPGATGTLKLDQSAAFTGSVAGFAAGDAIDLADIAFGATTTLGYAANAGGSGGVLQVSDGTHTANLALLGQYTAAGFATAPDPGSGTLVTYTAALTEQTNQSALAPHPPP